MNTIIDGLIPRVAFKFLRLADALLIVFVQNLIAIMTGNTNFTAPTPALTVVSTTLATFITKVQEAMTGGIVDAPGPQDGGPVIARSGAPTRVLRAAHS
jgi:hypothetical protein